MLEAYGLAGLFATAFLAATIFPFQSELLLLGLLAAGAHGPWELLAAASVGNTLGAVVNWALGRFLITKKEADIAAFKTPSVRNTCLARSASPIVPTTAPASCQGASGSAWRSRVR